MDKKTLTVVSIAALAFYYFKTRAAGVKKPAKKKLKPVITPLPLQNITEQEYYGTKADYKAGVASDISLTPGGALSVANAAGLISSSKVSTDISNMPISNEIAKAMRPGRCN